MANDLIIVIISISVIVQIYFHIIVKMNRELLKHQSGLIDLQDKRLNTQRRTIDLLTKRMGRIENRQKD